MALLTMICMIVWFIGVIAAFFVMKFWWTIISLVIIFVTVPIEMVLYAPFRKLLYDKQKLIGFISGIIGFIVILAVYLFLHYKFQAPIYLLVFIILWRLFLHVPLIVSRSLEKIDWVELGEMIAFIVCVVIYCIINYLLKHIGTL